ncbi:ATP-binding protein [Cryobacterium sp. GrIS_2_6]|uniref:ATP-binding protein n=1 Tax=Cryobacterium sp. GrIS_2_6 TaxID=3162785 RepID=UPI002E094F94|nr:hypothetical protein [Cryobacterium psychrotolerans]
MLFDDLGDSARTLLRGRGRAIGGSLTVLARAHANSTSQELAEAVAGAGRSEKSGLGLLLARVALEDAVSARSRELFNRFLFRFGAHLKTSVSEPGLSAGQRLVLAIAADEVFEALASASTAQRREVSAIRHRLTGPNITDTEWNSTLGVAKADFDTIVDQFSRELGDRRRLGRQASSPLPVPVSTVVSETTIKPHPLPTWLSISFPSSPDPLVTATANWHPEPEGRYEATSVSRAWSAFREGEYAIARAALEDTLAKLGTDWGPTSSADALRTWNWIRLVTELAAIDRGDVTDVRRSWTSACGFVKKCLPDDAELIDCFVENAIGDFVGSDLASIRAWSAYTMRLVSELGHETALALYSNKVKADVREAWAESFRLTSADSRSTASAAAVLVSRYRQSTQKLYLGARDGSNPARVLRDASHHFVDLLDEAEGVLFSDALELSQDMERLIGIDGTNHRDLRDLEDAFIGFKTTIAVSGSGILQDFVSPLLQVSIAEVRRAIERLGDMSRPDVKVQLSSSKLPFSAANGSTYQIRFVLTNSGNATAEGISLRVIEHELGIDTTSRLDSLGPGSEGELSVTVTATGSSQKAVALSCELHWTDALLQQFDAVQQLSAEDQMPVAWAANDVNPFSLGTISEPERLVGRAADLASLDALIAGRASAYITGHKRVGKTSLTRVLLRSAREKRGWAGSVLPLGRALGQDQTAGDLVYALLDEILDAARDTYGEAMDSVSEVRVDESGNFARAANRWLRGTSRALPEDARVIIAIDDFDELPAHLVKGPQADSLFLFLRSLVDEEWLNLIVVGSEILPSIIQAQAHKLNQVVPVSVTNFSSRSSTAELLQSPTSGRLEWVPDAIDRVHSICSGNPYYETLVAQRLWQTMRECSRSVVTASDVDEAANSVARDAPDSHFVHLWADSSNGLDHTARSAIVASAVLRSIARCGGDALTPAALDEVIHLAQGWIQTATVDELNQTIATLRSGEVVRSGPSGDRLLISIPLVGVWLLGAGGRVLDGVYSTSKHATATVRMITDSDLVELARQLRYRGEQVTEIRIKAWLEQFGGNDRQYLAYKMLRRMIMDGFFTSTRLQAVELPRLATAVGQLAAARVIVREANNQNLRNAFLINHGVAGDSTQGTLSLLAKTLKIKKANILRIPDLGDRIKNINTEIVLFLLDDYCGTGTHLARELNLLVEFITGMGEEWIEKVHIVVGASVVADKADLPTADTSIAIETVGGTYLGDRFRPFNPDSGVFDTAKEREDAEEMTASIGRALMPRNPLGFGGRALLTLFEFNCPNNVAPIFWQVGNVSGTRWTPLFERAM